MVRRLAGLAVLAATACASAISPTGGQPPAGDGGLSDGGRPDGGLADAGFGGGDGGLADAGFGAFDGGPIPCTSPECLAGEAELNATVTNLGAIVDGGTTSFGGLQLVTTFDGGVKTIVVQPGAHPLLTIVYPDSTHVTATGDTQQKGLIDYQFQAGLTGTTIQSTELTDTNFDGIFDEQEVASFDASQGYPMNETDTYSVLQIPDGGLGDAGAWVQSWTFTGSAEAQQGTGSDCDGMAGFPDNYTFGTVPGTKIGIVISGPASCNANGMTAGVLVGNVLAAITSSSSCYLMVNPKVGAKLATALASEPLVIACGNSCAGVAASTDLPGVTFSNIARPLLGKSQRMNLNPAVMAPFSDNQQMEVLIHELLHFAGLNHDPPPAGDPTGHDLVYGCGRYCTRCKSYNATYGGSNTAPGWAWDCSECADDSRRFSCGEAVFVGGPTDASLCAQECKQCLSTQTYTCPQNQLLKPPSPDDSVTPFGHSDGCCSATQGGSESAQQFCVAGWGSTAQPPAGFGLSECTIYPVGWCTAGAP